MFHKFVYTCVFIVLYSTQRIQTAEHRPTLEVYNVTCLKHSERMKIIEGVFQKFAINRYGISVHVLFNQDLGKPVHFRLRCDVMPKNSKRGIRILDIKLNACSLLQHLTGNILLKSILTEFKRTSNYPTTCRFIGNFLYRLDNFTLIADILPSFWPIFNFTFGAEIFEKNKLLGEWQVLGAKVN